MGPTVTDPRFRSGLPQPSTSEKMTWGSPNMALIGSFALLLAFALSVYSFGGGLLSLFYKNDPFWNRVGETARRAGVVVFGCVFLAAVALVVAAFRDDFSIAYIFHHSNRDLPAPYKFAATLWSGQEGSLLFWSLLLAGYGFVLRLRYKTDQRLFAYASVVLAGVQIFFLALVNFAANPFGLLAGPMRADGSGLNPLFAISRDGHPSAHALSGLRRLHRPFCFCHGRAHHEVSRREVDPYHSPLDHGDLGISYDRHFPQARTGPTLSSAGEAIGDGIRSRTPR